MLAHLVAFLVDLTDGAWRRDRDKDLPILVLRHQVRLLRRQRPRPPRLTRGGKLTFAVLTAALAGLDRYLLLFKPDTVFKWHRELVRRKRTYRRGNLGGRLTIPAKVETLIRRLARENPRWGHRRIQGSGVN